MSFRCRLVLTALVSLSLSCGAQSKRLVTASDCVQTKYLLRQSAESSLKINHQGTLLAYVVRSPNLQRNVNDEQLYISELSKEGGTRGRLIVTAPHLSQINWLADGKHIAVLSSIRGHVGVVSYDAMTGKREVLASLPKDIDEYGISEDGNILVYVLQEERLISRRHSIEENAVGYRIPNDTSLVGGPSYRGPWVLYKVWMQRRNRSGRWMAPSTITIHSPFTGKPLGSVSTSGQFSFSFSPDGLKLLFNIADVNGKKGEDVDGTKLPQEWQESPTLRRRMAEGGVGTITVPVLQDLTTGRTSLPIATPGVQGVARWSPDSSSFFIVAVSPVGSAWEAADDITNPTMVKPSHLWRVEVAKSKIDEVFADLSNHSSDVLLWAKPDSVGIRTRENRIVSLAPGSTNWTVVSEFAPDSTGMSPYSDLASDGKIAVVDFERSDVPPELRIYRYGNHVALTTQKLNSAFDEIQLVSAVALHWKTSNGTPMTGSLFLPPGYRDGVRYPLVIQTKNSLSGFVCDASGGAPSFAPQPMASQGLLYLVYGDGDNGAYPAGYPGGIGEAIFNTDLWDSAVSELDRRGMIDPEKVGIIGFSRTGWHVEFALAHGKTHYAAATAADNIQYSLGEYWLAHTELETTTMDVMYGGSPYGEGLSNWMKYSISFNLDKIHTPLLMEEMGDGVLDDTNGATPNNLARRYEIVSGLIHLKKPVELFYYPNEQHDPEDPKARLATVQRNVDWYRFWLQGYERPSPEDPEQYKRWEQLRDLRDEDAKGFQSASDGASPVK